MKTLLIVFLCAVLVFVMCSGRGGRGGGGRGGSRSHGGRWKKPWGVSRYRSQGGIFEQFGRHKFHFSSGKHGIFRSIGPQWWRSGPNVCSKVDKTSKKLSPDARQTPGFSFKCSVTDESFKCSASRIGDGMLNTTVLTYECCPGWGQITNRPGCPRKVEIGPTTEVLKRLGCNKFRDVLENLNFDSLVNGTANNWTLFAPNDDAMEKANISVTPVEEKNDSQLMDDDSETNREFGDFVSNHLVTGTHKLNFVREGRVLQPLNENTKIRLSKGFYGRRTPKTLANCVPVTSQDNLAFGVVIHKVAGVLNPLPKSVMDVIREDDNLSEFAKLIESTPIAKELEDPSKHFTIFAPNNEAMNVSIDKSCILNTIKSHIGKGFVCSRAIGRRAILWNLMGERTVLSRSFFHNKVVRFNGIPVTETDKVAMNGVVHVVPKVLNPFESQLVKRFKAYKLITNAISEWENKTGSIRDDYKMYLPPNRGLNDQNITTDTLLYHVLDPTTNCSGDGKDRLLATLNGKKLRYRKYSIFSSWFGKSVPLLNCIPIKMTMFNRKIRTCKGFVRISSKMFKPPQGDLYDVLKMDGRFTKLLSAFEATNRTALLNKCKKPKTLLAIPDNKEFEWVIKPNATDEEKDMELKKLLAPEVSCLTKPTRFGNPVERRIKTLGGKVLQVRTGFMGRIVSVGDFEVTEPNIMADNGVVHIVRPLMDPGFGVDAPPEIGGMDMASVPESYSPSDDLDPGFGVDDDNKDGVIDPQFGVPDDIMDPGFGVDDPGMDPGFGVP